MQDRIAYNSDGVTIDEVIILNASVHLERLDDSHFMLKVESGNYHWHFTIFARNKKSFVDAILSEDFIIIEEGLNPALVYSNEEYPEGLQVTNYEKDTA